jgi:hypothetical protein
MVLLADGEGRLADFETPLGWLSYFSRVAGLRVRFSTHGGHASGLCLVVWCGYSASFAQGGCGVWFDPLIGVDVPAGRR